MNKSSLLSIAMTFVVAALGAAPHAANAAQDTKGFSPMGCRPLTATDATGLVFDTRGIINSTTVNKRVICEIDKDAEAAYSPTSTARFSVWYKPGAVSGYVSCTFYRGSAASTVITTTSGTSGVVAAGGAAGAYGITLDTYPSDSSTVWHQIGQNVVCTLSSKMTLAHFYFAENSATNTP